MDWQGFHQVIHKALLQRRKGSLLWESPLDNAWVGLVLLHHKAKDQIVLKEIKEKLASWYSSSLIMAEREIAAAGIYSAFLKELGEQKAAHGAAEKVKNRLLELRNKGESKFSVFNSPELFYAASMGLIKTGVIKEDKILQDLLVAHIDSQIRSQWFSKVIRFVFFSDLKIEIDTLQQEFAESLVRYFHSLKIETLHRDEIIPLLWFLEKNYGLIRQVLSNESLNSNIIDETRQKLWQQLDAQKNYYILHEETQESSERKEGYFLSTVELALLDELLLKFEKDYLVLTKDDVKSLRTREAVRFKVSFWVILNIALWLGSWLLFTKFQKALPYAVTIDLWILLFSAVKILEVFGKKIPFFSSDEMLKKVLWWVTSFLISGLGGYIVNFLARGTN